MSHPSYFWVRYRFRAPFVLVLLSSPFLCCHQASGAFFQTCRVSGHMYGVTIAEFERIAAAKKIPVLCILDLGLSLTLPPRFVRDGTTHVPTRALVLGFALPPYSTAVR